MEVEILIAIKEQIGLAQSVDEVYQLARRGVDLVVTDKSIASIARKFKSELTQLAKDTWKSGQPITRDMRQIVKQYVEDAYLEGLKEGGIAPDEISEEDALMIVELNETQQDYIKTFAGDVKQAQGDKDAQAAILQRIEYWSASIEAAGTQGLASAKANEMVIWRMGSTEEHCQTCRSLNGQKHRRKWFADKNYFPQTPGASLDCKGFQCLCTLKPVR